MGTHWMLTGYVPTIEVNDNLNPSCGSSSAKMRGRQRARSLPAYVCLPDPPLHAQAPPTSAWPTTRSRPAAIPNNAGVPGAQPEARPARRPRPAPRPPRVARRPRHDPPRRRLAGRRSRDTISFYRDAFEMVTGAACRERLRHPPRRPAAPRPLRPRHLGPERLLARRLVEAGVTFVTRQHRAAGTPTATTSTSSRHSCCRATTRPSAALVEDLHDRGLARARCWSWPTASSAARRGSTRRPAATTGRARCRSSSPAAA